VSGAHCTLCFTYYEMFHHKTDMNMHEVKLSVQLMENLPKTTSAKSFKIYHYYAIIALLNMYYL